MNERKQGRLHDTEIGRRIRQRHNTYSAAAKAWGVDMSLVKEAAEGKREAPEWMKIDLGLR